MSWQVELVAGPYHGPTGGVAWDGGGLLFSLISESRILRYVPESGDVQEFRGHTNRTNGLALSPHGQLYGCQNGSRRVLSFNKDGSASVLADRLDGRFHNHPKDLAVDRHGRIWFTDPFSLLPASGPQLQGQLEHASVLLLHRRPNREWYIQRMTYDTSSPSGIALSVDGHRLYVSENDEAPGGKRELRAYPIREDLTLGRCTVLHTFGEDHRGPHRGIEGMCIDREGNLVGCAGSERSGPGPMIYFFAPTGRVLETLPVPADCPMNCTFGDADLQSLYISTAGGHLFRARRTLAAQN